MMAWNSFFNLMTTEIPDTLAGSLIILVMAILFIWAVALIIEGHATDPIVPLLPWYHPRRWFVPGFPFSLGWYMLVQGVLNGILGLLIFQSPSGILVWMFLLILALSATALAAFIWWARDRIPGEVT